MSADTLSLHLRIIGVLLIGLALAHIAFPRYFKWTEELASLSLINRQMMQIHTLFIALVICLMGMLCLRSTHDLIETELGKTISLGFGIFWFVRLWVQFFGYSHQLWKGKRFETVVHVVFSMLWVYMTVVFLGNCLGG